MKLKILFVLVLLLIITGGSIFLKKIKQKELQTLNVRSVFKNGEFIPQKYTCDGLDLSPPIYIDNLPPTTKSLVILVQDYDAPQGLFLHWLAWNIEPKNFIEEGFKAPREGLNDFGKINYGGPCPPPGKAHRYYFKLYAINSYLNLPSGSKKEEVLSSLKDKIIAEGEFYGLYSR